MERVTVTLPGLVAGRSAYVGNTWSGYLRKGQYYIGEYGDEGSYTISFLGWNKEWIGLQCDYKEYERVASFASHEEAVAFVNAKVPTYAELCAREVEGW